MEENKFHPTSIRLTPDRMAKLDREATKRNLSRSELVNLMIDGMEEVFVPPVKVRLPATKKEKVMA